MGTYTLLISNTGASGQVAPTSESSQKSVRWFHGSYVRTSILLCSVVARERSPCSGSLTILPSIFFGFSQSGLLGGGRVTLVHEPVTFPHAMTLRLWLGLVVSNTASTARGT